MFPTQQVPGLSSRCVSPGSYVLGRLNPSGAGVPGRSLFFPLTGKKAKAPLGSAQGQLASPCLVGLFGMRCW